MVKNFSWRLNWLMTLNLAERHLQVLEKCIHYQRRGLPWVYGVGWWDCVLNSDNMHFSFELCPPLGLSRSLQNQEYPG